MSLTGVVELAQIYEADCDGNCDKCPLGSPVTKISSDLPKLPKDINICALFDYINQNKRKQ